MNGAGAFARKTPWDAQGSENHRAAHFASVESSHTKWWKQSPRTAARALEPLWSISSILYHLKVSAQTRSLAENRRTTGMRGSCVRETWNIGRKDGIFGAVRVNGGYMKNWSWWGLIYPSKPTGTNIWRSRGAIGTGIYRANRIWVTQSQHRLVSLPLTGRTPRKLTHFALIRTLLIPVIPVNNLSSSVFLPTSRHTSIGFVSRFTKRPLRRSKWRLSCTRPLNLVTKSGFPS